MSRRFALLLARITKKLEPLLETDAALREDVRALGEEMLRMAEAATPAPKPEPELEPEPAEQEAPAPLPVFDIGQHAVEPAPPPATLAWSNDPAYASGSEDATPPDDDAIADDELSRIEHRARLKAEACRWALERRERLANGAEFRTEIKPVDEVLIARAKELPDCFLWMCGAVEPGDDNHADWIALSEAFDNLAAVSALLQDVAPHREEAPDTYKAAVELMAECQSAVREAVERAGADADADQDKAFHWLRNITREQRIFVDRHMRDTDRADPADWEARRERIAACALSFNQDRMRQKATRNLFGRLKYHVQKLEDARPDDRVHHTNKIVQTVDDLVASGLPPSNRDLRGLLNPVLDLLPAATDNAAGYRRTLDELYRFLDTVPVASQTEAEEEFSSDVEEVRALLANRVVVVIGGDPRPDAAETLKRAFDLADLDWVHSNKHQSYNEFRPHIAKDEVAVVLLAIRWSSHSFANVKAFCDELGKPLVRLPAGYGANQVARQVLEQVAERLHA